MDKPEVDTILLRWITFPYFLAKKVIVCLCPQNIKVWAIIQLPLYNYIMHSKKKMICKAIGARNLMPRLTG